MKSNLKLPSNYSIELAEETGIHIGDGSLGFYNSSNKNHWAYTFSFHSIDDKEYGIYVKNLMKKLYNLEPYEKRKGDCSMLVYTRKELVLFKKKLNLPIGAKTNIEIPNWILNKREFKIACVRGIFDTDGSVSIQKKYKSYPYYPCLAISSKSKNLILQIRDILKEEGFNLSVHANSRITPRTPNLIWRVSISGADNFRKYNRIFGFSNPKHSNKFKKWKKSAADGI